jgi:cell division protein FtsB
MGTIAATVFVVEVQMPLGFTPWLLYLIPLGLTYWAPYRYAPLVVAALCTVLLVLGYFLSPAGVASPIAVANRTFGTVTFWILGFLILRYKLLADQLSQLTKHLALELTDRTRDLGLAVSALQQEVEHRNRRDRDPSEAGTELAHHVTTILSTEGRRLREKIARYKSLDRPADEAEKRLDTTRNELMQLGQRLERLQQELLQDGKEGT